MKNETKVWDLFAPVYNVFMRTNRTAYEQMYTNIRAVIKDKRVLEIACGTGLISKNVADAAESYTDAKLIDTTDGMFMTKCEAKVLGLSGSTLLTGTK